MGILCTKCKPEYGLNIKSNGEKECLKCEEQFSNENCKECSFVQELDLQDFLKLDNP